jgi:RNA polymerase sigma factor (sigma-70 family)
MRQRKSDESLLLACRAGDAEAWSGLLGRYERLVYSIPLSYGVSPDDAADVAQQTFTSLIEQLGRLQDGEALRPWLVTVARRNTWRVLARRRREPALSESMASPEDDGALHTLERWEAVEWLDRGLSALDERCRQLLLALYCQGEIASYEEVATRTGMPLGSIGPTRGRCLARLRAILASGPGPGAAVEERALPTAQPR